MSILKNLSFSQRLGLVLILGAVLFLLAPYCAHADTLTMWPCHTPVRAGLDDTQQSALIGLIVTIGAVLFMM